VARNLWLCGAIGRGIRGLDGALVSKAFAALPQAFRYLTSQGQIQVFDQVSRRGFLALVPFALAACTSSRALPGFGVEPTRYIDPMYIEMYAALPAERYPIPAFNPAQVDPRLLRQVVPYQTTERAGTIIVDPGQRYLYLTRSDGYAIR